MAVERSQSRSAWLGAAIIGGIMAVGLLVFFVPIIARWLQPSIEIVALMDDAGALKSDSPVWVAGREIGSVVAVGFRGTHTDSAERVAVRMRLPKKHAGHIRRDSEARITSRRLIGEPVIDITPGTAAAPAVQDGDTLRLQPRGRMTAVLERAEALNAAFAQLFEDMRAYEAPAGRRAEDLKRIDRQLAASMTGFKTLVATLQASPIRTFSDPAWSRLLDGLAARARDLSSALDGAATRARAARSEAQPSLDRLAARADTISGILADMQARVSSGGGGLLLRAQKDSAITKQLGKVREQLDSLIAETTRNPLRFWL